MATKKSYPAHIRAWKIGHKINFRIIASNGKTLVSTNQGYNNMGDVKKNLRALRELFDLEDLYPLTIPFHWYADRRAKKRIRIEQVTI